MRCRSNELLRCQCCANVVAELFIFGANEVVHQGIDVLMRRLCKRRTNEIDVDNEAAVQIRWLCS